MMQWLAGPGAAQQSGNLVTYVTLSIAALAPVIAALQALANRRTRRERDAAVAQAQAQVEQTKAQGQVIATGDPLQWRNTDHTALLDERAYSEKTRNKLSIAEEQVRELLDRVAAQDRKIDAMVEDLRQLRVSIASCPTVECPIRPSLDLKDLLPNSPPSDPDDDEGVYL